MTEATDNGNGNSIGMKEALAAGAFIPGGAVAGYNALTVANRGLESASLLNVALTVAGTGAMILGGSTWQGRENSGAWKNHAPGRWIGGIVAGVGIVASVALLRGGDDGSLEQVVPPETEVVADETSAEDGGSAVVAPEAPTDAPADTPDVVAYTPDPMCELTFNEDGVGLADRESIARLQGAMNEMGFNAGRTDGDMLNPEGPTRIALSQVKVQILKIDPDQLLTAKYCPQFPTVYDNDPTTPDISEFLNN